MGKPTENRLYASMFRRHRIVGERDARKSTAKMQAHLGTQTSEKVTKIGNQ